MLLVNKTIRNLLLIILILIKKNIFKNHKKYNWPKNQFKTLFLNKVNHFKSLILNQGINKPQFLFLNKSIQNHKKVMILMLLKLFSQKKIFKKFKNKKKLNLYKLIKKKNRIKNIKKYFKRNKNLLKKSKVQVMLEIFNLRIFLITKK